MFDPKTIKRGREIAPRKVVIYGPPKQGKSTLAACAPDALLIPTEDRVKHIDVAKTDVCRSFEEVMSVFEYLMETTPYKTVIVDTIDWLEPLLHQYICSKKGFSSLYDEKDKEVNFGRGLKYHAVEGWRMFLQNCDVLRLEKNMSIILVAHSTVEKYSPPDADAYDRYNFDVDKHAASVIREWADVIGFYNTEVVVRKEDQGFNKKTGKAVNIDGDRVLNLQANSPAWISGNSYGLPDIKVTEADAPEIMRYILNTEELEQNSTKKTNNKKEVK
jgi:hypothetical protein